VPRDVRFVDRLPHLPNGKVDRQHLRRSADTGAAT
jgi:acyl-coenzyme A synthetase/AMP-(fatty) acid ligase